MNLSALQLRCLIANDVALIEHYSGQLAGEDGIVEAAQVSDAQHEATLTKLGDTIRRAQRRRAALESLQPAAPQPCHVATVTRDAVQPATSS
jgi:hypothetical protein